MEGNKQRLISLRVSESDYANLTRQANGLGLKPAVFARVLLRSGLSATPGSRRHSLAEFHEALAALDALAPADEPAIAGVEEIRRARAEREAERADLLGYAPPG
ncbi:MAG: hypothetical protein JF886_15790 [Candidatus Dormibacteraeota bacterium]|uniref:Uncharacterized protein n=1 Tax=Candidatus Aeolococcus gillhamiae TaxID=3127015 RepID=A0A2W6A823_9BACT|nr:hypothetical protein [Candidatus Dormibacteraeota bacterium]PZR79644.1 MAG: hypothetical protein DLM65_10250 [Candidatus Dormibacter sp. RRmetagenome_bin12]